jgi:hypothetical protein
MSSHKKYARYENDEDRYQERLKQKREYREREKDKVSLITQRGRIRDMINKIKNGSYIRKPKYSIEELSYKLDIINEKIETCKVINVQ